MDENNFKSWSREELQAAIYKSFCAIDSLVSATSEAQFQHRPQGRKWSIAENIYHLMLSNRGIASALGKPKEFFVQFGKPDQPSRTYGELADQYFHEIRGRQAPEAVRPKADEPLTKQQLLDSWQLITDKFEERLALWTEEELDRYVLPHLRLGKLTMREMLYFVIYHNKHHLSAMQRSLSGSQRTA